MSDSILAEAPAPTSVPEATPSTPSETPVYSIPEWGSGLSVDKEILSAPLFKSVKSIDDVVKGYYHQAKMIGADKIVVPNKNSSSDEWRQFYVKAGLPEKFEDYKAELPKSFDNQEFNSEFLKTAYELNVKPDQIQKMAEMFDKANDKLVQDYEEAQKQSLAQTAQSLKQEWGQGYEKQIATANRVIKHFGGEELHKQVLSSDLANNGDFLRLMAKIGSKMTQEDSFQHGSVETFGMTKEEARGKINAIYGDPNSPYFNDSHAQHKEVVEKMLKYQEILST